MRRLRQLNSFGRFGIHGQPWGWTPAQGMGGGVVPCPVVDSFTGVDGTSLDAHAPDVDIVGGGWTEHSGVWELIGNALRETSGGQSVASIDAGIADADVETTWVVGVATNGGVVARVTDASNYYLLGIDTGSAALNLWRNVAGVFMLLDTFAVVFVAGDVIRLRVNGTTLEGYINDVLRVNAVDASHVVQTRHGFFSNAGVFAAVRWDDFSVCRL